MANYVIIATIDVDILYASCDTIKNRAKAEILKVDFESFSDEMAMLVS
ncbi:hypothetical protein J18TS1_40280 [Oceanobacillus oncorhynchi subsp. incaldanensis]|nr:hypothetical protein J18TS1_40280 [Oceanobacillus oncorhynchi subsp. incaldanensis]